MKTTLGRKTDDKSLPSELQRMTSSEDGLEDAASTPQTFQQHLPLGGNLCQGWGTILQRGILRH